MADDELSEPPMIATKYHRRLDRTPEKNFDSHSEGLKILTCENRKALEKVSAKMTKLHDEIDNRDKTIEEEKKLRKEAEDKLHAYLVDPYSNPDINDELRERLPRANKTDPLRESLQSEQEIDDIMDKEQAQNTSTARSQDVGMNSGERHNPQSRTADSGGMMQTSTAAYRIPQTSLASFPATTLANPFFGVPHLSNPPVYLPHSYTAPYLSPFLNSPLQQQPSNYLSPPRTFGTATGNDVRLPAQASPLNRSVTKSDEEGGSMSPADDHMTSPLRVSDLHQSAEEGGDNTEMQNEGERSTTQHTTAPTFTLPSSTFIPSFRSAGFGGFPQHPPSGGAYFQDTLHPRLSSGYQFSHIGTDGQSRQVALLLAELDTEKAKNKKLVDRVADLEIELEMSNLTLKTSEVDHRNSEAAQAAGLVQEVHAAQKKRDESVMGRIKVASQEKEDALYRLRALERRLEDQGYHGTPDHSPDVTDQDEFEDEADDENVENVLTSLGQIDRVGNIDREWTTHIQKIEQIKHRQKEITAEEMQMLMDQRDAAVAKAKRFEELLLQQQRKDSHITEQNLRERLRVAQHERDLVVAKNRQLKEEINTIGIYYSLHKSLSQDSYLQDNTFPSPSTGGDHKESNTTMANLREMEHEKLQKEADLQKLEDEHRQSQEKILRLEKLVEVLRRKLRTQQREKMQDE